MLAGVLGECRALAHLDLNTGNRIGAKGARVLAEGVHAEGVHGTASDDLCLSCNDIGAEGGGGAWRVQGAGSFELQRHFNWIGADTCWQGCLGT